MDMPSPCRGICQHDAQHGWCVGCGRTETEITRWNAFSKDEKILMIRTELKRRLKIMGHWPMTKKDAGRK